MDWKEWSEVLVQCPRPLLVVALQAVLVGFDPGIVGPVAMQERVLCLGPTRGENA